MKRRILRLAMISALSASMVAGAAACGTGANNAPGTSAATEESAAGAQDATSAEAEEEVSSVTEIDYANVTFDFSEQIAEQKASVVTVPEAAAIDIELSDAKGVTGMVLVGSLDEAKTSDFFLNAYAAGDELTLNAKDGAAIKSVSSSVNGDITVTDGAASFVPAALDASEPTDEIITVTMEDGTEYNIHTWPEAIPDMTVTGEGVAAEDAGAYYFTLDKFLLCVNTEGELVFYRDINCIGELMIENFAPQNVNGKTYYSAFIELNRDFRNFMGGFSSGMYVLMDENFNEIDQITLAENDDPNHTHGEGYLDQHEFVMMDENHYILLSYTPLLVNNLPDTVEGIDGTSSAYVWAGIIQEVKDGKVISEVNTADYPLLYDSAVEKIDYANSTDQEIVVNMNGNEIPSKSDGWMDYVHVNSVDYTLDEDGTADKILVSMRDQCAVYQFDIDTGALEWILGGKASTLGGYEEYAETRADENGTEFQALTYAQHFARYTNKAADGTIDGNVEISVFDNNTGSAPFSTTAEIPNLTRTFKATIDMDANTATISNVINGVDLNQKTDKYHLASHCGSVQYESDSSVAIGWGCHGVIDEIGAMAPEGTFADAGYDDLRQGDHPVVTDYNPSTDTVTFELSATRSPMENTTEAMFAYRVYKAAE